MRRWSAPSGPAAARPTLRSSRPGKADPAFRRPWIRSWPPGSACSWPTPPVGEHRTETGETYTALVADLVIEVLAETGRHGTLTVARARWAEPRNPELTSLPQLLSRGCIRRTTFGSLVYVNLSCSWVWRTVANFCAGAAGGSAP